jgi:putative FmdB family regulatory protein
MPIFEFACNDCPQKRFSELVGMLANPAPIQCPRCGSKNVRKLVSRFARLRSSDEALDSLAELADNVDESSPQAMRHLMKEVAHGMDADLSGDDVEELFETAAESEE